MHLIIIGPPGAGKGTQADYISKDFKISKISTGDILRIAQHHDKSLNKILNAGNLVSDDKIIEILLKKINNNSNGFILDGFPRTLTQAKALKNFNINIDAIIQLKVPDKVIIRRITGRRVHLNSGRTYHTIFDPPKVSGIDDLTGESLMQREDDKESIVIKRLYNYHKQTEPLMYWYKNYTKHSIHNCQFFIINGTQEINQVYANIKNLLNKILKM